MIWTILVILIILWLLGFLDRGIHSKFPRKGGWSHRLIVIAVILNILHLLGGSGIEVSALPIEEVIKQTEFDSVYFSYTLIQREKYAN